MMEFFRPVPELGPSGLFVEYKLPLGSFTLNPKP